MSNNNYDNYLKDISLIDFIKQEFGELEVDEKSTKSRPKYNLFKRDNTGNRVTNELGKNQRDAYFVFSKDEQGKQSVYVDSNFEKLDTKFYNIVSLVQHINGGREKFNLGKVRGYLDEYMQSEKFVHSNDATVYVPHSGGQKEKEISLEAVRNEKRYPFNLDKDLIYLRSRGFKNDIINTPEFKNLITLTEGKNGFLNTSFVFRDNKNNTTGYLRKFNLLDKKVVKETDQGNIISYKTFKNFRGIKNLGIFSSNDVEHKEPKNLVIGESPEDVISQYYLDKNSLEENQYNKYVATGGNYGYKTEMLIDQIINERDYSTITLIHDNDKGGKNFICNLITSLSNDTIEYVSQQENEREYIAFLYDYKNDSPQAIEGSYWDEVYKKKANEKFVELKATLKEINKTIPLEEDKFGLDVAEVGSKRKIIVSFPSYDNQFEKITSLVDSDVKIDIQLAEKEGWDKNDQLKYELLKEKNNSNENTLNKTKENENEISR